MHKSHLADKLKLNNATLSVTRDDAVTEQGVTIRKLALSTTKSKELQKNIEKDISARYQNRKVNIMGGVQSVWIETLFLLRSYLFYKVFRNVVPMATYFLVK